MWWVPYAVERLFGLCLDTLPSSGGRVRLVAVITIPADQRRPTRQRQSSPDTLVAGAKREMKENDCELGCRVVVGDVKKGAGGPINDNGISPAHSITTVFLFNSFNSTTPLPCASTTQGLLFSARALSVLCVFGFFSFRPASESVVIRHGLACRWLRDNVCCLRSRSPSPFGQCTHTSQNNAASCLDEPLSAQFLSITTNTSLPTTVATFL